MITVLKFFATWCGPCGVVQPQWEATKEHFGDKILFQEIDIDSNPGIRADFHVRTIPMFIMVQDGVEIARKQGSKETSELISWIKEHEQKDSA